MRHLVVAVVAASALALAAAVSGFSQGAKVTQDDDAPIRVRNGSVYIEPGATKSKDVRWKWDKKGGCKDKDGGKNKCLSREPEGDDVDHDTDQDETLFVQVVDKNGVAKCDNNVLISSGALVSFEIEDPPTSPASPEPIQPFRFFFRRNTSGNRDFRVQLLPDKGFLLEAGGKRVTRGKPGESYIKSLVVMDADDKRTLACTFSKYDVDLQVNICSPWEKRCGQTP
jgi:hypothetical protein